MEKLEHPTFLSRASASVICSGHAKRKKTLCAPHEPQKVLVVELVLLFPVRRMPYVGHRVDGLTGPFKAGDLLPFQLQLFYNRPDGDFNRHALTT